MIVKTHFAFRLLVFPIARIRVVESVQTLQQISKYRTFQRVGTSDHAKLESSDRICFMYHVRVRYVISVDLYIYIYIKAEVGIANFFLSPLIANPLILFGVR
jgi:fucose permease